MRRVWHEDGAMAGVQTAGPFACRMQSERMRSALLRSPDRARLANGAGQFGVRLLPWERPVYSQKPKVHYVKTRCAKNSLDFGKTRCVKKITHAFPIMIKESTFRKSILFIVWNANQ